MEITVTIDEHLLEAAQAALGTPSVDETVEAGLREVVRARELQEAIALIGTEDLLADTLSDLLAARTKDTSRLVE
jgi:Arc/MetJ family transcription regulator